MHPDDDRLERLLRHELAGPEVDRLKDHLASCLECERRYRDLIATDSFIADALSVLDPPPSGITLHEIRLRAGQSRRPSLSWKRMAAAIVLGFVFAGAAYAAPRSPLPSLVDRLLGSGAPEVPLVASASTPSGIAVQPQGDFTINVIAGGPGVELAVGLDDLTEEISVRSMSERISYRSDPTRLSVSILGEEIRLDVVIPASARFVRIESDGATLWVKEGNEVTSAFPADSSGIYHVLVGR